MEILGNMNMLITTLIIVSIISFLGFQAILVMSIVHDRQAEKIFHDTIIQSQKMNISKSSVITMAFRKISRF